MTRQLLVEVGNPVRLFEICEIPSMTLARSERELLDADVRHPFSQHWYL
jgi:hypothetical protein